jgi:hypothetical protein
LINTSIDLMKNEALQAELKENILKMAMPGAASVIAKEALKLANYNL